MADTDPLEYKQRAHPDLDVLTHYLTLWDLDREFATGGFAGKPLMKLRDILGVLRDSYTRSVGIEYMHIQDPDQRKWIQDRLERKQDLGPATPSNILQDRQIAPHRDLIDNKTGRGHAAKVKPGKGARITGLGLHNWRARSKGQRGV
jgi:hypothetical protein